MTSLELLKKACALHSQRKVARTLNRSVTAINQVLHEKYPKPEAILEMVELAYGGLRSIETQCPVLGMIHTQTCERYRGWAKEEKVHPERMYRDVKEHCANCVIGGMG